MATGWEAFPLELKGGLVSNMSRLQQGLKAPGSARVLVNFEPSVKGGYRRINGFSKYSSSIVPVFGEPMVQASGQTGTTLVLSNLFTTPVDADTFTIDGVAGTYTIATSGVSYSTTNKEATLTLTTSLATSPADKAVITFTNKTSNIEGLHHFYDSTSSSGITLAYRDGSIWSSTGSAWTNKSAPDYGSVLVAGGSQTGATLDVDAITSDTYVPHVGDTFSIAGVEKVYTVLAAPTVTSGAATVSIYPSLATSPANNAIITFLSADLTGGTRGRFANFNFSGTERVVMVDGTNYPIVSGITGGVSILDGTTDILAASVVTEFSDHLFFGKGSNLVFNSPFSENDFSVANGGGTFRLPAGITGLINFRDKLIIFTTRSIHQLTGTSVADFSLSEISTDLGCSEPDTIQEVGGDIMYLGVDGLRFLGATARIGDFNLSLASRTIQDEVNTFRTTYTNISTVVVRGKSQYRILGFTEGATEASSTGYLGTQFTDQEASGFNWGKTTGIKAYRTTSVYTGTEEVILFSGETGYVYKMEDGNTFDGTTIEASFHTPFMAVNDPRLRKTLYKATTYYDPEGDVSGSLTFKYDFQRPDVIQPISGGGTFSVFGADIYNTVAYGGKPETVIETNATGSFFTVSLQYEFTEAGDPPFVVDTVLLEYSNNDRK
tara:strand:+ start:2505 stop:4493 length:1989 start_codon:yes stop_codon:yes gene_type:complete